MRSQVVVNRLVRCWPLRARPTIVAWSGVGFGDLHREHPVRAARLEQGTPHNLHNFSSPGEFVRKSPPMKRRPLTGP